MRPADLEALGAVSPFDRGAICPPSRVPLSAALNVGYDESVLHEYFFHMEKSICVGCELLIILLV